MELLQISPSPVYPPRKGGELRSDGLLRGLATDDVGRRFCQVGFSEGGRGGEIIRTDSKVDECRFSSLIQSAVGVLTNLVDWPMVHASHTLRASNPAVLDRWIRDADVVMVEHPWQFSYASDCADDDTVLVYSSHNFEPELYQHLRNRTFGSWVYRWIERIERRAVQTADLIVVTSERHLQQYRSRYDRDSGWHVAHNGVSESRITDPQFPSLDSLSSHDKLSAIFVGSAHPPNVQAVEHIIGFARKLCDVDVRFDVVGTVADAFDPEDVPSNVVMHGFVEDLSKWYRAADVAINPITGGSGSNLKLVEYLSKGLPVISTIFGTRGFPFEDGRHLVVTDIESFPEAIRECVESVQSLRPLVLRAQDLIREELVWEHISKELLDQIEEEL